MTVDKLSDNRVLIVLCGKDMEEFSLDFDTMSLNDLHSRKMLLRIMQLACVKYGINISGNRVKLEALSVDGGCYILMTVESPCRRTYRFKSGESICYHLGTSGNFLDAIDMLYRQKVCCNRNSAYVYDNQYYLIFDYPSIPRKLRRVLSEYGEKRGGALASAKIKEGGKLLCRKNAIAQIGKYLV